MTAEPTSTERLAAIRRLDLDVLAPGHKKWSDETRAQAAHWARQFAPVLNELLDDIEAGDTENETLLAENRALRARLRDIVRARAVVRWPGMGLDRMPSGRWRVRWSEDGWRRSQTYGTRAQAEGHLTDLRKRAQRGGGR